MSANTYALSADLGALSDDSDRRFKRLLLVLLIPAVVAGTIIPFIKIASLLQEKLLEPERYAKLIQQQPVEPPKKEEPKVEPKPKPQLTPEQKLERARQRAKKQLSTLDTLKELRDTDLPTVNQPLAANVISSANPTARLQARSTSGGIGEIGVVQRSVETGIGSRATTGVTSGIGGGGGGGGGEKLRRGRTLEEIQAVFDRTKGAFYTMYVREQRQNPDMIGKMVVKITIAPGGQVTKCTLVSSELRNPEFEKKVIARVLLMDFGAKDVPDFTVDYPILFFPS